jgi:AsmA protein
MTRRASILAYSLAIALGLLGLQSWSIAVGRVEQRVIAAIEARTGLVVTGMERAEIALLPLPRISVSNVRFTQRDGLLAGSAVRIKARARLLPLLIGRFSFNRIDLVAPQIDVAVPNDSGNVTDWLAPPLAYLENLRNQSRIVIASGSIFIRAQGAIQSVLRDVNLYLEERDPQEPINLSGSLTWRGIPTELSLLWPMADGRAKTALSVTSSLVKLRFEGSRSGPHDPVINGQLALSAPSLSELLGWFDEKPRLAAAIGSLTLAADAQIKPHEVSLSNAVASLDGERLDGAIKLGDAGERLSLSGTLAGANLDLGRLVSRLQIPALGSAGDAPLTFDSWTAQDIDLRVSVDAARANGARLADVATYLLVKKGRFEAGLLRANAYGGSAKGRFLAVTAPGGVDVKLQIGLDKVNFGQAADDVPQLARLGGTGGIQINLDGLGHTVDEVIASLSGRANLALRQGEISGIALAELLRRAERSPALVLRDWRQGKTSFETATANAGIANGLLVLTDAQMSGPSYKLMLAGTASLPARTLDMSALLTPVNGSLRLPFTLKGPMDDPALELDLDATLRPAGAQAFPTLLTR